MRNLRQTLTTLLALRILVVIVGSIVATSEGSLTHLIPLFNIRTTGKCLFPEEKNVSREKELINTKKQKGYLKNSS